MTALHRADTTTTAENIACNAALPCRDDPAGHLTMSPLFCDDDDDDDDK
jgi:hypothetical protein